MSSAYLERPLRSLPQAQRDQLTNLGDLYFFLQQGRYGLEPMERDFPVSRKQAVKDLAEGQHPDCVVVLCGQVGGLLTDVTDDIMDDVAIYRRDELGIYPEPPEREYEHEDAA